MDWGSWARGIGAGALLVGTAALTGGPAPAQAASGSTSNIVYITDPPSRLVARANGVVPTQFTPSNCIRQIGLACYTPTQIRVAYNVPSTLTGAGQTIVIVDAYGSPTVRQDLQVFDRQFGLPDPTLNIIYPGGSPTFNPLQSHSEVGWAEETSLDVQWAHAIAPGATIDLVVAANNAGNVLNNAASYAVSHSLGNVMSMSYGADEAYISGGGNNLQVKQSNAVLQQAANAGMSVFASAGDGGATDGFPAPTALYPASNPLVTAVGGTDLFATDRGKYQSEQVWNDGNSALCPYGCQYGPIGAGGGAISSIFTAPAYQQGVTGQSNRTVADVSYNAGVYTGILVYLGFLGPDNGFYIFGGTSAGSPQWASIAALADQAAGRPLGPLNPRLYGIYGNARQYRTDFYDVTVGDNAYNGPGYRAGKGYDIPTGLGSPNVANLIATLTQG